MRLIFLSLFLLIVSATNAQLLSWTPEFIRETSPTIEIVADALKGNQGLKDYSPSTDVYIHIGAITNLSTGASDWKYVKFPFNTPAAQAQCVYMGNNKWKYTISGGLKSFFGITNPSESVVKVAVLFRNGAGSSVLRNTDGSDMYVPVYDNTLQVRITDPVKEPKYLAVAEPITKNVGDALSVSSKSSEAADLKLYLNGAQIGSTVSNGVAASANTTITAGGEQVLVAEAKNGSTTKYDTLKFFVATATPTAPLPAGVSDGVNYESGDTSAILVLHAPGKNQVHVIGDFNNWAQTSRHQMFKTPDGSKFWVRVTGLTPASEYAYQYLVDGSLKIADPYTEKILDPSNDQFITSATYPGLKAYPAGQSGIVSVLQTRQPAYNWAINSFPHPEKRKLVIYELLLRDFLAAHDWKTLRDTLSYLKRLGVNAIEVMPFNEFEGNNSWGYNGYQYFAPDKYYGPKNFIKEFVDSCHKNGIAVIMDIVLNHTYGPSPLARLYWDAANNRPAANNPWYNAVQPHAFGFGEDFNHESAATKSFFNRVLQHWVTEYKIDGYRVDFSKGLTQRASTSDAAFSAYDASRIAIINNYYNTVKTVDPNAYFILEHFADNTEEKELSDGGMMLWSNVWTQYQEASMGYLANSNFQNGIHTYKGWSNSHLVGFMESHDEERITYKNIKYGNGSGSYNVKDTATALKRMELNAAFMFTIPGPKMIYEFGELGYDYSRCYLSTNGEGGDCNRKTDPKPIRWDYQGNPNRKALFDAYAKLIRLRNVPNFTPTFISNDITYSLAGGFKWIKVNSDSLKIFVIGNFDVVPVTSSVSFQNAGTWYNYMTGGTRTATGAAENITLQPGEYIVYTSRDANNFVATPVRDVNNAIKNMRVSIFPNPVFNTATIQYDLPESGKVQVSVLNSTGQQVAVLFTGFKPRGVQTLQMGGSALSTGNLASGNYLLKVEVNGKVKVQQFFIRH